MPDVDMSATGDNDADFNDITAISGWDASVGVNKIVFIGDFTDGWSSGWLINAGANAPTTVTTIDMSQADFSGTSSWKFVDFNNLTTINWPEPGKITNIPSYAFQWTSAADRKSVV